LLPQQPGQKEQRYTQLLSEASVLESYSSTAAAPVESATSGSLRERVETLEKEVGDLKADLQRVREELAAFRKQFE